MTDATSGRPSDADAPAAGSAPPASGPRRLYSPTLFRDDREIVIIHRGQEYRLRITKTDKLILTK